MLNKNPVAIIGAGLAGLTAASFLKRNDIPFRLFEAGPKIAGLATSFKDNEGFSYDFGAHFVTNRLADEIGIGDECLTVKHYGEAVYLDGKTYSYPFGLIAVPRMAKSAAKGLLSRNAVPANTAEEWFRGRYGTTFADEVALPLIEAWSGAKAEKLSPAVGESLPTSILRTLYLKTAGRVLNRAVACGYSREMPESARVYHVYPKQGVSGLCESLAQGLEQDIRLESPVEEILVENEKVVAIRSKGETHEVAAVVSTAPANVLGRLVTGTDKLKYLQEFRYRPMVFVNMKFDRRPILPDTVVWFPETKFPFFRLTEATHSMPWLAPDGKTMVTVDIGCENGDEIWNMSEDGINEMCLEHMCEMFPNIREIFLGSKVLKTPIAYPIFLKEYEIKRKAFEMSTGIDNLLSVGRNGEFRHIFMEDVFFRTLKRMSNLIKME